MIDPYTQGEIKRQEVLDILHAHGPMYMSELATLTGTHIATMHKRIISMLNLAEVSRSDEPRHRYTALVEKTTPASYYRGKRDAAMALHNEARRKRIDPLPNNRIRIDGPRLTHICSDVYPAPAGYGGGQGRHRPARGFASTEL